MNDEQLLRYSRQIMLPDIDVKGQQKLNDATVLIMGLGGLGSVVAYYLAGAGVGHLILNDFDDVDWSNLQRQIIHNEKRIGMNKAVSARETLQVLNSDIKTSVVDRKLDEDALLDLASQSDVLADGSDNFQTRRMMNTISLKSGTPLVSGAAIRMEGQISTFNLSTESPCYQCLYGNQLDDEELTCSENGVIAPLVGIIGSMQAMEVMKIITGIGEPLDGRLMLVDAKSMGIRTLNLMQDPACSCHESRGLQSARQ